ncbi:MAG: hypothetical protein J5865_03800 [Lachnospiraceae bacterium]|nr:hypothetical protein [Lachnospiraceae bacterium]
MKVTSAEAGKLVKKLEEKISALQALEEKSSVFRVASGEDEELLRPVYDFLESQKKLEGLQADLRTVKHAINVFNTTHTLPGFDGMTVDQALIALPQLSAQKVKLSRFAERLPRERVMGYGAQSNIIDYTIANYKIEDAAAEYDMVSDRLSKLQLALDKVNHSEKMEIDITLE